MLEKKKIIAHRGIHDNLSVYENSIEAIKLAVDKNYAVEIDVRLTLDGKIIVFHDNNLNRMMGKDMIIEENNYDDLKKNSHYHIPLLEEILDVINCKVPILIEIKDHKKIGKLETKLVCILNNYDGDYLIQSFNPYIVYWFKKNFPFILRGQLSYSYKNKKIGFFKRIMLSNMLFNKISKPHFISYKYDELPIEKIRKFQKCGVTVLGWTINNRNDLAKFLDIYDNLIVDNLI